ncbi:unnamed protein product [Closterium sp. NIES-54]
MASVEYSTTSDITHVVKGLPSCHNLMKRLMVVPGTCESLDKDSLSSYIIRHEAMQEAERPTELLPQASYAAPTKQSGQHGKLGRGGSGGRGQMASCRLRRDDKLRKEKQTSKKTSSTKDVNSSRVKGRGDGEASCSMAGVVELLVSLASQAREDFKAVTVAMQANPMVVVLNSGCLHHLMGTTVVFVDMVPSCDVKHVRGFNRALQTVEGRDSVALQGEARKQGDAMLLVSSAGKVLGGACYTGRVLWTDLRPCSTMASTRPGRGVPPEGLHQLRRREGHRPRPDVPLHSVAERETWTVVESVRTMLLHMGVQHQWWHLALRQAVWVRCVERSTTPPGTTPYQLLTEKKPDLTLARVWGCMVQFMVPEHQRGGNLALKARWGLHLGVPPKSKGWELLDLTDNKVVTSVEVIFYETLSLELVDEGKAAGRTTPIADRPASTSLSATGDEGSLEASLVAPANGIVGSRQDAKLVDEDVRPSTVGEQQTGEMVEKEA